MDKEFRQAITKLRQANEDFKNGRLSSVAHGNTREAAIIAALTALARSCGVQLAPMHRIDTRGELHIVAQDGDKDPRLGCGHYGKRFAALLTTAKPRTGVVSGITLDANAGWCYVNHFEAEKLVLRYATEHIKG